MLQIQRQQSNQLAAQTLQQALLRHWQATQAWFLADLPPQAQHQLALRASEAAREQGLASERDVFTWCDLCIAARTGFAARPSESVRLHG